MALAHHHHAALPNLDLAQILVPGVSFPVSDPSNRINPPGENNVHMHKRIQLTGAIPSVRTMSRNFRVVGPFKNVKLFAKSWAIPGRHSASAVFLSMVKAPAHPNFFS